jgi:hypothetical protein
MNCKDIEQLLQAYHDGELDATQRREVESHLAECPHCQAKLAELSALDGLLIDGEAEKIPDPGKHYWHSFSGRITRKLIHGQTPIIRTHRVRSLKFKLIPILSGAVAVFLVVVISIPLLKKAPAKFTQEEVAKLTAPPTKSNVRFQRTNGDELLDAEMDDLDLSLDESTDGFLAGDIKEGALMAPTPSKGTGAADIATSTGAVEKDDASIIAEQETAAEVVSNRSVGGAKTRDERTKPSTAKVAESPSGYADSEDKTLAGGAAAKEAEETWGFDRQFKTETDQTGILRVEIDSTGQLAKVTVYRSSGDARADSIALKNYQKQWEGKIFRERQRALYVPFNQDANN